MAMLNNQISTNGSHLKNPLIKKGARAPLEQPMTSWISDPMMAISCRSFETWKGGKGYALGYIVFCV